MSVIKIKKHIEKIGKELIDNDILKVDFLHETVTSTITIRFRSNFFMVFISDDTNFDEKYTLEYNDDNNQHYNFNEEELPIVIEILDNIIYKQIEFNKSIDMFTKQGIMSKVRQNKIETILNNITTSER